MSESMGLFLLAILLHGLSGHLPRSPARGRPLISFPARLTAALTRRLDRSERSSRALKIRGAVVFLCVVLLCGLLGLGAAALSESGPYGWIFPLGLTITALRFSWPWRALPQMKRVLQGKTIGQNAQLTMIITKHRLAGFSALRQPDTHGLLRFALGSVAGSLARGLFAPLIGGLIAAAVGLPWIAGLCLAVGISEFAQMTVGASQAYRRVGTGLNQALQALAGLPATLCFVIAAFITPRARPLRALRLALANGLKPQAALAGALDVTLGGPSEDSPWYGLPGTTARLENQHLSLTLWLHYIAVLVALGFCAGLLYILLGL